MSYPSPGANHGDSDQQPFYSISSQQQSGLQNSDEQQMSAQLSAGLAPIMNANSSVSMNVGPGALNNGRDARPQDLGDMSHLYTQRPTHRVQPVHSPVDQLDGTGQYRPRTPDGPSGQKQRSKSSRACDECRRKKVKCIPSDTIGDQQCKNCTRGRLNCRFSRTPLKRGPSKGYIKDLADRVNQLENQVHPSGNLPPGGILAPGGNLLPNGLSRAFSSQSTSPAQPHASEGFSQSEPNAKRRRVSRTPDESEEFGRPSLASHQRDWQTSRPATAQLSSAFTSPQLPIVTPVLPITTPVLRETNSSPNGLQTVNPRPDSETLLQQISLSDDMMASNQTLTEHVYDLTDGILDEYYSTIHSTYPLLSEDRTKLQLRLSTIPIPLSEAFNECVHAAVRSFPENNHTPLEPAKFRKGATNISLWGIKAYRPLAQNIVYLQCLLLLAIEAGNLSIAYPGHESLNQKSVIATAVALAFEMKMPLRQKQIEGDVDSDDYVLRRIWWVLVVMDRCVATTKSTPYLIPEEAVVVNYQDLPVIGEGLWNLSRLAITLGHYSVINSAPEAPLGPSSKTYVALGVSEQLDRCRDTFPANFYPESSEFKPVYHMLYWHIKLLVTIEKADLKPRELLEYAYCAKESMVKTPEFVSPLKRQCFMVILLALIDLRGYDDTKEEAEGILRDFLEVHLVTNWDSLITGLISQHSQAMKTAVEGEHSSLASQGLRRLAVAAAREVTGTDKNEFEFDSTATTVAPAQIPKKFAFLKDVLRQGTLSPVGEKFI